VKFPHCRAKVKVRARTGGENHTVLKWTTASRKRPCGGGPFFTTGERLSHDTPREKKSKEERKFQ
jgi:hypothetical protein